MGQPNHRTQQLLIIALLIVGTALVFWRVTRCDFVGIDDQDYVYENHTVRAGLTAEGIAWAFKPNASNWHPLTWLSHMLDAQIYKLNPFGHHLTSLLLHIVNVVLLFFVLTRMTGKIWRSAAVAALFALHPLHVESVAWVAERKDVLSTLFWILTVYAYVRYVEDPTPRNYGLVAGALALGLMSKPMLVSVPIVLLLLDYWPLRRFAEGKRPVTLLVEKAPLFAMAAASCAVTFFAQSAGGAVNSLERIPLALRIDNALVGYVSYIGQMLWPSGLAVLYPHPMKTLPLWAIPTSGALLAALTCLAFWARRRAPFVTMGWLWYLVTLAPVIGLVQVGIQSIADRYTYVPLIGLFVAIAWGVPELASRFRPARVALAPVTCAVLAALAICSYVQIGCWRNSVALFSHAIAHTKRNYLAHNNLGFALYQDKKPAEALKHFQEALRIAPDYTDAHVNLGVFLAHRSKYDEAAKHFEAALRGNPNQDSALNNLGFILVRQGKIEQAKALFTRALEVAPYLAVAHIGLADVLMLQHKSAEAATHYEAAARIGSNDNSLELKLANCLAAQGKLDGAVIHFRQALRIDPTNSEIHYRLALVFEGMGNSPDAIDEYQAAMKHDARRVEAANNLAWIYATNPDPALRRPEEAIQLTQKVRPHAGKETAMVVDTLAAAYASAGRFDEAASTARVALKLALQERQPQSAKQIRQRLLLYEKGKPYVEKQD